MTTMDDAQEVAVTTNSWNREHRAAPADLPGREGVRVASGRFGRISMNCTNADAVHGGLLWPFTENGLFSVMNWSSPFPVLGSRWRTRWREGWACRRGPGR
jgi:hypothetical protein